MRITSGKEKEGSGNAERTRESARAPCLPFSVFRSRATDRPLGRPSQSAGDKAVGQRATRIIVTSSPGSGVVGEREERGENEGERRDGEEERVEVEKRTNESIGRSDQATATSNAREWSGYGTAPRHEPHKPHAFGGATEQWGISGRPFSLPVRDIRTT